MIFIFMALYQEAAPLIRSLNLKQGDAMFPSFFSDGIRLTLTGTGPLAASSVAASVLSSSEISPSDILLSIGTCAALGNLKPGTIALIHRIHDLSSGRDYYPDIISSSLKQEASLITGGRIGSFSPKDGETDFNALAKLIHDETVYDMESAGIFQAGSLFLSPHQMRFIRVVSDQGEPLSAEDLSRFMTPLAQILPEEIRRMKSFCTERKCMDPDIEPYADDLGASLSMRRRLRQIMRYCRLAGIDFAAIVSPFYREGRMPVKSKEEGKNLLREIEYECNR